MAAIVAALCSCSEEGDEGYKPQMASAMANSLLVAVELPDSTAPDYARWVAEGRVAVIGHRLGQRSTVEMGNYRGLDLLDLNVALPDERDMTLNRDRTEGRGTTLLTLDVDGTRMFMQVNFELTTTATADTYGGSAIRIASVEHDGQTIARTDSTDFPALKMVLRGDSTTIEPLGM